MRHRSGERDDSLYLFVGMGGGAGREVRMNEEEREGGEGALRWVGE